MNYVEHFDLFGVKAKQIPCIPGKGAPTTATEGAVGCLYMDTDTGELFKCTAVADGSYTWVIISAGGGGGASPYSVLYTPQNLTPEEQAQARQNIGALGYAVKISKNLADIQWQQASITNGAYTISSKHVTAAAEEYIPVKPSAAYTFSCAGIGNLPRLYLYVSRYDANKNYIDYVRNTFTPTALSATHIMTADTVYIRVHVNLDSNTGTWNDLIPQHFQIEQGSAATSYEMPGSLIELDIPEKSVTRGKLGEDIITPSKNIFKSTWANAQYNNNGIYSKLNTKIHAGVPPEIPVIGGKTYAISWGDNEALSYNANGGNIYIHQFDENGNRLTYNQTQVKNHSLVLTMHTETTHVGMHIYASFETNSWEDLVPQWVQVELGSKVTELADGDKLCPELLDKNVIFDIMMLNQVSNTVRTIAHRGDPLYAPQCTAPAYIVARKRGHTIMENDVMPTGDGHLVMWHDATLSKLGDLVDLNGYHLCTDGTTYYWVNPSNSAVYTYDTDYVASNVALSALTRCAGANYGISPALVDTSTITILPFDVLRRIDFGVWFDEKYKGTQILTFEEWIMLCKQLGCEAYVDHKLTYAQITDEVVTEMASIVKRCGMADFTSFLGISAIARINKLRETIPDARIGILKHPSAEGIATYTSVNSGRGFFFNGDAKTDMTAEAVQLGLNAGFDVEVWYVDYGTASKETVLNKIRTAVSYGVTGITADHYRVDEAFKYLLEQYGSEVG